MPVPDEQKLCEDFGHCEFCDKCYEDSKFVRVIFDNDKEGKENEKRMFEMCKDCREKCRIDKEYEKYATEKAFKLKLGRRVKVKVYDQD
jgi:hypothetical protein